MDQCTSFTPRAFLGCHYILVPQKDICWCLVLKLCNCSFLWSVLDNHKNPLKQLLACTRIVLLLSLLQLLVMCRVWWSCNYFLVKTCRHFAKEFDKRKTLWCKADQVSDCENCKIDKSSYSENDIQTSVQWNLLLNKILPEEVVPSSVFITYGVWSQIWLMPIWSGKNSTNFE